MASCQARRYEWAGIRERINFWDAESTGSATALRSTMLSSPDKCLVQDAFLWPVVEIKPGDASNVADNATTREKTRAGTALPIDEVGPHKSYDLFVKP
jgi:hypothetical protein